MLYICFFLSLLLDLPTRCRCKGLLLHLIGLNDTHTHTHTLACTHTRAHTHSRAHKLGRTPLDKGSARRRHLCLTTHNTHNRQTAIPCRDSISQSQSASGLRLAQIGYIRNRIHGFHNFPVGPRRQAVRISATSCPTIAIFWVRLLSYAAITLCLSCDLGSVLCLLSTIPDIIMDDAEEERSCVKFCFKSMKYSKQLSVNLHGNNADCELFSLLKSCGISVQNVSVQVTSS